MERAMTADILKEYDILKELYKKNLKKKSGNF